MTATRMLRLAGWAATLVCLAVAWFYAASLLWRTRVPADLELPHVGLANYFSGDELRRSARFENFLRINFLAATITELAALAGLALAGRRLARYFDAGRVGTGVLIGTLITAVVWLVDLPFGLASQWWERRYGISRQDYGSWLGDAIASLAIEVPLTALVIVLLMLIAGRLQQRWWLGAGPLIVALGLGFGVLYAVTLDIDTKPLRDRALAADIRRLARVEGTDVPSVRVEQVSDETTAANAEAIGIGPIRKLLFWNTLLDGRFTDDEVRVVAAHELAHLARQHVHKGFGWFVLFTLPLWYLVALATRRLGGLARPEAVPLALLVAAVLQLTALPLENVISRRYEAEADWIALGATRDPVSAQGLFARFSTVDLVQPRPPHWDYVLLENHPTTEQRIAMARAWLAARRRAAAVGSPASS
jgi:Zn-dependent protease with chaperone function